MTAIVSDSEKQATLRLIDAAYADAFDAANRAVSLRKARALTEDRRLEAAVHRASADLQRSLMTEGALRATHKVDYDLVDIARDALQKAKDDAEEIKLSIRAMIGQFLEANRGVSVRGLKINYAPLEEELELAIVAAETTQSRLDTASGEVDGARARHSKLDLELKGMRDAANADDAADADAIARLSKRRRVFSES